MMQAIVLTGTFKAAEIGLQSSCRNNLRLISGNGDVEMNQSSILSFMANVLNTYAQVFFLCFIFYKFTKIVTKLVGIMGYFV